MRERPRAIYIATAVIVGLFALLALWVGVNATFMPLCARCHMKGEFATATQGEAHATVACKECHGGTTALTRVEFGANQTFGMQLKLTDPDPSLSSVPSVKCRQCHASDLKGITENGGLRVKHSICAVGKDCTDCHAPTAHGAALSWPRTASMEMCYECHARVGATTDCDKCHTDRLPSERVNGGTFPVTHGPNHEKTHGLGKMSSCGACHEESKCSKCHGAGVPHEANFIKRHSEASVRKDAKCEGCHIKAFCADCHRYEMPHPKSFKPKHAQIVKKDGQAGCLKCHVSTDCFRCHEMHVHPTTLDQLEGLGVIKPEEAPEQ